MTGILMGTVRLSGEPFMRIPCGYAAALDTSGPTPLMPLLNACPER